MAKQIHFTHDGTEYILGFTLNTVKTMQQQGFVADELATKPAIRVPELFYGSFQANHRGIKRNTVDAIWKNLKRKDDMIIALAEMYAEAQESIIDEGNEDWTMTE